MFHEIRWGPREEAKFKLKLSHHYRGLVRWSPQFSVRYQWRALWIEALIKNKNPKRNWREELTKAVPTFSLGRISPSLPPPPFCVTLGRIEVFRSTHPKQSPTTRILFSNSKMNSGLWNWLISLGLVPGSIPVKWKKFQMNTNYVCKSDGSRPGLTFLIG